MLEWAKRLFSNRQVASPTTYQPTTFLGNIDTAGVNVNESTAISLPAIYSGVNQLARTISTLPLFLYRTEGEGRQKAVSDRRYRILHTQPNPYTNKVEFWHDVMADCLIWRNAFIYLSKDRRGIITAMWRIRPDMVKVDFDGGEKIYDVKTVDENGKAVAVRWTDYEIMHVIGERGTLNSRLQPAPLHHELARSIGVNLATEDFTKNYYEQGTAISGIVTTPESTKASADTLREFRKDLESRFSSSDNAHKIAILRQGMEFQTVNHQAQEAQLLEGRKFNVIEVARLLGMPPSKLQSLEQVNYSTAEQEQISFRQDAVRPWVTRIEAELESKVIRPSELGVLDAEFNIDALERANLETRYNAYSTGINNGFIKPNEARALENLNPVEGGNKIFIPLNLQELGEDNEGNTDTDGVRSKPSAHVRDLKTYELRERVESVYHPVFYDAFQRIANKEYKALKRAIEKYEGQPESFDKWATNFYERLHRDIRDALHPVVDSSTQQMEHIVDINDRDQLIEDTCQRAANRYIEDSKEYIHDANHLIEQWVSQRLGDTETEPTIILKEISENQ